MTTRDGLAGKRIAISGAASGIGFEIARQLHAAGSRIALFDLDGNAVENALRELPGIIAMEADVAVDSDMERFFASVRSELGGLDALVNNAGIAGPTAPIEEMAAADWRRCVDVGLTGQFLCARLAVPMLKEAGGGAIVNMSSVAGKLGLGLRAPYSAVKAGVIGLTLCLARELGPSDIRVNAILPGIVRGKRIEDVIRARAEAVGIESGEMEERFLANVSLRQMVEAADVAAMAAFLISDAGLRITGQSIAVDGNVETI